MQAKIFQDVDPLTREQALLLKMVFLPEANRIALWEGWRAAAEADALDMDMYTILPMLYSALAAHSIEHEFMKKLKGVWRRAWYKNQRIIHQLNTLAGSFSRAGIAMIFPRDPALACHYYKDVFRPIHDIDILVRRSDIDRAGSLIVTLGWQPKPETISPRPDRGCQKFVDETNQTLTLRHSLAERYFNKNVEDGFWSSNIEIDIGGAKAFALNPSDQIFYLFAYELENSRRPYLISIGDVFTILNNFKEEIDWGRVALNAERALCARPLRKSIAILKDELMAKMPDPALPAIQDRSCLFERLESALSGRRVPLLRNLILTYGQYLRSGDNAGFIFRPADYLQYMQRALALKSMWQLPSYLLRTGLSNIWMYDIKPVFANFRKKSSPE